MVLDMSTETTLPEFCPEHPTAQVRREWNRKQYIMNGYPAGRPIDTDHQYFCNECNRELAPDLSQYESDGGKPWHI